MLPDKQIPQQATNFINKDDKETYIMYLIHVKCLQVPPSEKL